MSKVNVQTPENEEIFVRLRASVSARLWQLKPCGLVSPVTILSALRPTRREFLIGTGSLLVLGVAGCGSEEARDEPSGGTRTVEHALGDTEVPENPERIATADYDTLGTLLALGVEPVGTTGLEYYGPYLEGIPEGIESLDGEEGLPNLERVALVEPDLIVGPKDAVEPVYDQLSQIAPTVALPQQDWKENLRLVAGIAGETEQAERIIEEYDARIEELRAALGDRLDDTTATVVRSNTEVGTFRNYGRQSLPGGVLDDVGLPRPATEDGTEEFIDNLSFEQLINYAGADVLFFTLDPGDDLAVDGQVLEDELRKSGLLDNPLWQQLPAVRSGNVYPVNNRYWIESNPFAVRKIVDDLFEYLVEQEGLR